MLYDSITKATQQGRTDEALRLIDDALAATPDDAVLHYLRGNVFMKQSLWGKAMGCFRQACLLDPESPAAEAGNMLTAIMEFYNKDMYNQ